MNKKQQLGQYYTRRNPFTYPRFRKWLGSIPGYPRITAIEPFAGSNNIIKMMTETFPELATSQWTAFDIAPEAQESNQVPEVRVQLRDSLLNFPQGYDLCVTNPPYLAKNSATRKNTSIEFGGFQDLFEISLDVMLTSCAWVAAIIPESFISRAIFQNRLEFVISLADEMFDDTEFPVCLAVFSPTESEQDFEIWRNSKLIGKYAQLSQERDSLLASVRRNTFRFNDSNGAIGLYAVDMTNGPTIRFVEGDSIASETIKHSSRAITRISARFPLGAVSWTLSDWIIEANRVLGEYRNRTNDVFMTSFKGLRDDGHYRRRLDWDTASRILATALSRLDYKFAETLAPNPKLPW